MSKTKSQKRHARLRAAERFGVGLTNQVHRDLVQEIQARKAQFVYKHSNRVTVWELEFAGQQAVVAYDKSRKTVVTLIPADEYYMNHPNRKPRK